MTGVDGFKLSNGVDGDKAGFSASGAGDVNGDGLADLIVGAPFASAINNNGAAYVVFGKTNGFGNMALSDLDGANGFKLTGAADGDYAGWSVSGAGDVNGDGFGDLLVGAYGVDGIGTDRGAAYVVYGFGTATVNVDAKGKSATFTDWDGDLVTIKATQGPLNAAQFHLSSPNPLTGGSHLVYVDFTGVTDGTGLTLTAEPGPRGGDGLVNVGTLDARSAALGKVSIDGDLQQVDADAIAGLTVYSLGQFAAADVHGAPLKSDILAAFGALTVETDASRVTLAAQTFGAIKALSLDDVRVFAAGLLNPAKANVIKSLTIGGSVSHSQILAGYDSAGNAFSAEVQIGKVKVLGNWLASDLVAGVRAGDDGIFGTGDTNEKLIAIGNSIIAKIASITIAGAVRGTADNPHDGFGFAAEEFGALSIGNAKLPLQKGARNDTTPLLLGLTGDVRVREAAL